MRRDGSGRGERRERDGNRRGRKVRYIKREGEERAGGREGEEDSKVV